MAKILSGIFMWDRDERVSDRYGAFYLARETYDGKVTVEVSADLRALARLNGKRVKVAATVIESRDSGHCGDLTHEIYPSRPNVGEVVDLGVGVLRVGRAAEGDVSVVLEPGDGRRTFWIDPRKFYRLHDQTVEISAGVTRDDFSLRPEIAPAGQSALGTGDGVQLKNVRDEDLHTIVPPPPDVERIGDGLFSLSFRHPRVGERLPIDPERPRRKP